TRVAVVLFAVLALRVSTAGARAGVIVYGVCVTAMLGVSAIYHSGRLSEPTLRWLKRVDHSTILLAIAGSYTGITVLALHGSTRTTLLMTTWAVASVGVLVRMFWLHAPYPVVAVVYLVVGWIALIDLPAFIDALT